MESRLVDIDGVQIHVGATGQGADVLMLSGGPGCVHYLERDDIAPRKLRAWYPEPRGVGRSGGGPHDMERAIDDLEAVREAVGVQRWAVIGHSWGSDLAVRYAVEHPNAVTAVVGIAGRGPQRDRTWSEAYELGAVTELGVDIAWEPKVHASLGRSFTEWIHRPDLWRRLADCEVPMHLVAAGDDIRPSWPVAQLAELVPRGSLTTVPGVPHDFWKTHPAVWKRVLAESCAALSVSGDGAAGGSDR